ncbi:RNA polymerase sigma factor [Caulobacter segnis]
MPQTAVDDHARLKQLIEVYGAPVRAFLRRRATNAADVDDLAQEVFVRLLRRADLDAIDNIEGYIFQTAANILREQHRRRGRRVTLDDAAFDEDAAGVDEESSPERILLGREAYAQLLSGLRELPERARMVFVLNRYEQLPAREIARRMGLSVSLVEKEMMRAVAFLRDRMK